MKSKKIKISLISLGALLISCSDPHLQNCDDYTIIIHSLESNIDKEKRVNRNKYSEDSIYVFIGEYFTNKEVTVSINNKFKKKLSNLNTDVSSGLTIVESFGLRNDILNMGFRINNGKIGYLEFCNVPNFLTVKFEDSTMIVRQLNFTPRFE